jgi:hypothetical protein
MAKEASLTATDPSWRRTGISFWTLIDSTFAYINKNYICRGDSRIRWRKCGRMDQKTREINDWSSNNILRPCSSISICRRDSRGRWKRWHRVHLRTKRSKKRCFLQRTFNRGREQSIIGRNGTRLRMYSRSTTRIKRYYTWLRYVIIPI